MKKSIEELLEDRQNYIEALANYSKDARRFSAEEVEVILGVSDE